MILENQESNEAEDQLPMKNIDEKEVKLKDEWRRTREAVARSHVSSINEAKLDKLKNEGLLSDRQVTRMKKHLGAKKVVSEEHS